MLSLVGRLVAWVRALALALPYRRGELTPDEGYPACTGRRFSPSPSSQEPLESRITDVTGMAGAGNRVLFVVPADKLARAEQRAIHHLQVVGHEIR